MHVSCNKCKIEDILEFSKNPDEVFLEFLTRFDKGLVTEKGLTDGLTDEGIIRSEKEIKEMIGKTNPEKFIEKILFSKKDFISDYKILKNSEPKMGCKVEDLGLEENISIFLNELEIKQFYKFQEDAIQEIVFGENVVIEAPTASGKTEAFLIPVIQRIKKESNQGKVFAIFVYPTKALARDQFPKIKKFADKIKSDVKVFDGDTKIEERRQIIEAPPEILITNFDVLHYHLWHQTKFSSILNSTQVLVVDEAHVYSGIFGSNVHYIIKRLKRICNKKLQFVAALATLENDAVKDILNSFGGKIIDESIKKVSS